MERRNVVERNSYSPFANPLGSSSFAQRRRIYFSRNLIISGPLEMQKKRKNRTEKDLLRQRA